MLPEKLEDNLEELTNLITTTKALVKENYDLAEGTENAWDDKGVSIALDIAEVGIVTAKACFTTINKGFNLMKEALEQLKQNKQLEAENKAKEE
jgi:hypothetical protein